MKEIHLGRILIQNRHRRGLTQEELAAYIGVSKAAVSKWETGQSYPDITLLPQLAAYFGISIDELVGYEPQMDKAAIRSCCRRLAGEFAAQPFEQALAHCRAVAKKYYSCCPLLFQLASLLVNHAMLAGDAARTSQVLEEARELLVRVKQSTDDPNLAKGALQLEAYCLLALGRPAEALDLLDTGELEAGPAEPLLASAYQMTGSPAQARQVLQIGLYRELLSLCSLLSADMGLSAGDPARLAQLCARFQAVAQAFRLDTLHPGAALPCYLMAAQGWAALGDTEQALQFLEQYTALAASDIYPLRLHGDDFFDQLEDWLQDFSALGSDPPRAEPLIRRSMTQALTENPAFAALAQDPRFQALAARLQQNEEELHENS